jgi:hypothetical protein
MELTRHCTEYKVFTPAGYRKPIPWMSVHGVVVLSKGHPGSRRHCPASPSLLFDLLIIHQQLNEYTLTMKMVRVETRMLVTARQDGFGGLVVRMLASGSRVHGFNPGCI